MSKIRIGSNRKSPSGLTHQASYQGRCSWLWKYEGPTDLARKQCCTIRLSSKIFYKMYE